MQLVLKIYSALKTRIFIYNLLSLHLLQRYHVLQPIESTLSYKKNPLTTTIKADASPLSRTPVMRVFLFILFFSRAPLEYSNSEDKNRQRCWFNIYWSSSSYSKPTFDQRRIVRPTFFLVQCKVINLDFVQ